MTNSTGGTSVSVAAGGRMIRISDADPEERLVIRNALDVLEYATYTLGNAWCTLREAKMSANELARNLRNVLDLVTDDAESADE